MGWPDIRETFGLGFDHCAEIVPAPGALLLQVRADCREFILGDGPVQQLAVGVGTSVDVAAKRHLRAVRGEQRIVTQATERGAARPAISGGIIGHPGAYRVQVDVARAAEDIAFTIDETSLVASFPEGAGTPVTGIELPDIAATKHLHQPARGATFRRAQQQMHVVFHQHVSMQMALRVNQCLTQQRELMKTILIIKETRQAIVATLHDVLRDFREVNSGESGHADIAAPFHMNRNEAYPVVGIGLLPLGGSGSEPGVARLP